MILLEDLNLLKNNIKEGKYIVLDFFAEWCGPCKNLSPHLHELSEKYSNIIFYKIDVDRHEELSEKFEINAMPTIIFINNKKIKHRIEGSNIEAIKEYLSNNNN